MDKNDFQLSMDSSLRFVRVYGEGEKRGELITSDQFRDLMIAASKNIEKAPAEVMAFVDIVIHGEPLQDYYNMAAYRKQANDSGESQD